MSDHTATVEMKMWTPTMDALLRSCGVEEPERGVTAGDIDEIEERIRKKYWSLRGIIVEEAAYLNRSGLRQGLPERTRLFRIPGRCLGGKKHHFTCDRLFE